MASIHLYMPGYIDALATCKLSFTNIVKLDLRNTILNDADQLGLSAVDWRNLTEVRLTGCGLFDRPAALFLKKWRETLSSAIDGVVLEMETPKYHPALSMYQVAMWCTDLRITLMIIKNDFYKDGVINGVLYLIAPSFESFSNYITHALNQRNTRLATYENHIRDTMDEDPSHFERLHKRLKLSLIFSNVYNDLKCHGFEFINARNTLALDLEKIKCDKKDNTAYTRNMPGIRDYHASMDISDPMHSDEFINSVKVSMVQNGGKKRRSMRPKGIGKV